LHHLKAPMPDFIRRPPESDEAVRLPKQPVSINAEEVELPAEAPQLAPETASPAAEVLPDSKLDPEPEPAEGSRLILPPDQSPSLPVEPPGYVTVAPTFAQPLARPTELPTTVRPRREPPQRDPSAGWFWRAALALASVVLLALVLAFGIRWTSEVSASQGSGAGPAEKIAAASTDVSLLSAPVAERVPEKGPGRSLAVEPPAITSEQNSDHMRKESQVAKAEAVTAAAATAGRGAIVPRRHGNGLIARDTVTYFHHRSFAEAASRAGTSQRFAIRHRSSRKHDDVIAANAVALEDKPVPKAAKQDSGIKRYSDLK
jgi:hypothetical protein